MCAKRVIEVPTINLVGCPSQGQARVLAQWCARVGRMGGCQWAASGLPVGYQWATFQWVVWESFNLVPPQ